MTSSFSETIPNPANVLPVHFTVRHPRGRRRLVGWVPLAAAARSVTSTTPLTGVSQLTFSERALFGREPLFELWETFSFVRLPT
jgi:hypothetical protein